MCFLSDTRPIIDRDIPKRFLGARHAGTKVNARTGRKDVRIIAKLEPPLVQVSSTFLHSQATGGLRSQRDISSRCTCEFSDIHVPVPFTTHEPDAGRRSFPAMATLSKLAGQDGEEMTEMKPDRPVTSKVPRREWFGSRAALFAGFGTLLILMAAVSIDSLYTLEALETHDTQIRKEFVYREHTLGQVRTSVYESGDIMSDYTVIDSDPHTQERLRGKFQSIRDETTALLKACIESSIGRRVESGIRSGARHTSSSRSPAPSCLRQPGELSS